MIMIKIARSLIVSAALIAAAPLVLITQQARAGDIIPVGNGDGGGDTNGGGNCNVYEGDTCPPPGRTSAGPPPPVTGADSSGASIKGLSDQRFNQMITNRVLGTVLLGVN